jgi:hypothetical protein
MAIPLLSQAWPLARQVEDLLKLQAQTEEAFAAIEKRVDALEGGLSIRLRAVEDRLTRLEADQTQVVSEAKSAATGAATMIAGAVISDAVTRVTRVEERLSRLKQKPSPPDAAPLLRGDGATIND